MPVPVDLSGEVKQFVIDHDRVVTLRAMTRGDLPKVAQWRQQPHVLQWWASDGEPTLERVTEQYAADIDGTSPTRIWVAEVNGRSVGVRAGLPRRRLPRLRPARPRPGRDRAGLRDR